MLIDLKQKMKDYKDLMTIQFPAQAAAMNNPSNVYHNFAKYLDNSEEQKALEVPDFLKCPISDDLMDEPVVIQSGHTYEKAMIIKHFSIQGAFDPVTR